MVGTHLVLYDGACGLCNRLTQFLLRHDGRQVFVFASLQSPTGRAVVRRSGGNPDELSSFYVITDYQTTGFRFFAKSDAALFVAGQLGWPWKAAIAMRFLPGVLRNHAYDLVAQTRYRVFGRYEQCLVPTPEFGNRFID